MVVGNFSDETITFLFFVDVSGLNVTLGLLMFLKMGLLAKEDPTRCALERSDPFVYPLVHVAIASRCKNLRRESDKRKDVLDRVRSSSIYRILTTNHGERKI